MLHKLAILILILLEDRQISAKHDGTEGNVHRNGATQRDDGNRKPSYCVNTYSTNSLVFLANSSTSSLVVGEDEAILSFVYLFAWFIEFGI